MSGIEKYNEVFCEVFCIEEDALEGLTYQSIKQWDSVGHMNLISKLEDAFDIMFGTEDIIDFDSYEKGKKILRENYDVEL